VAFREVLRISSCRRRRTSWACGPWLVAREEITGGEAGGHGFWLELVNSSLCERCKFRWVTLMPHATPSFPRTRRRLFHRYHRATRDLPSSSRLASSLLAPASIPVHPCPGTALMQPCGRGGVLPHHQPSQLLPPPQPPLYYS
jgi:hypothetical protein